jgi:hypothetical protein
LGEALVAEGILNTALQSGAFGLAVSIMTLKRKKISPLLARHLVGNLFL